jgi:hypothetical protein
MAVRILPTVRIDRGLRPVLDDTPLLRRLAAFEHTPRPPRCVHDWDEQIKQARVLVDSSGYAYLVRNFGGDWDDGETAETYQGYTDVVVGSARHEA